MNLERDCNVISTNDRYVKRHVVQMMDHFNVKEWWKNVYGRLQEFFV